jgi:hypothetical protein
MLQSLLARSAALRVELVKLDNLQIDPASANQVRLAGCYVQSAIDALDQAHTQQAEAAVAVDRGG